MTIVELYEFAAQTAASMTTKHTDYAILAARIAISKLYTETTDSFTETVTCLYEADKVSKDLYDFTISNSNLLDETIDHTRDSEFSYFGYQTLAYSYLIRIDGRIVERPQHLWMRVAAAIHLDDVHAAIETYNLMSRRFFTHASPTLFNAGLEKAQMASCFLLPPPETDAESVLQTVHDSGLISNSAGGIGVGLTNNIGDDSSHGMIYTLRYFDAAAVFSSQGGGKRPGAFAMYVEPWHSKIFEFLDAKRNMGAEEFRARHLFYALWIPDLFMERVHDHGKWSLFDPKKAPGLSNIYGEPFRVYIPFYLLLMYTFSFFFKKKHIFQ